jgi:small subunit ribosomal protein S20
LTSQGSIRKLPRLFYPRLSRRRFTEISVANTKSAEKAARQAEKHRARNVALRSKMRSAVRKVTSAISSGNKDEAATGYKEAVSVVDSLVNKRIVHKNKASRHKARLSARIRAMQ